MSIEEIHAQISNLLSNLARDLVLGPREQEREKERA
jgi:hypothetical protein